MSTSQARFDKLPKQLPFASRKSTLTKPKFDMGYHVTVLGKYSKRIPKREISAIDRKSTSDLQWFNNTTKVNGALYSSKHSA